MGCLTEDPAFLATTFVVIDFETTTPTGHPAQPIEVAILALRYQDGSWTQVGKSASLIRPPAFAPVTSADTVQTGLTRDQLNQAPGPADVLGALDRRFMPGSRYLFVAQHAPTEANVIHNQREHCPTMAQVDFLDTIPFAKYVAPGLPNYKLDTLLAHFSIKHPADRHRAYADVDVTARVFFQLVSVTEEDSQISDLEALIRIAGRPAKCNAPATGKKAVQSGLFDI